MRMLVFLFLGLCACPQLEVLCAESDRCEPPEAPPADLASVDLAPVVSHFTKLELPGNPPPLRAISGFNASVNTIYAVGSNATVLIGDGVAPFVMSATSPAPSGALHALFVPGAQEVWVADFSNSTVHRTTNGGATWTNTAAGAAGGLQGIFGKSANDILAVGQDTMEGRHYMSGWAAARYPGSLRRSMYGVWASATNFYIAGSGGTVGKSSNPRSFFTDISLTSSSANLRGVWGVDDNNVYVVGSSGAIYRYDGSQWSSRSQGGSQLNGIWGSSAQDIWVVGDNGTAYHYDGAQWKNEATDTVVGYHLTGVWGDGRGGVWAVATDTAGTAGAVFKY